jgi:predicted ATPase/DNA-binding NarL/FixJ family response regulator
MRSLLANPQGDTAHVADLVPFFVGGTLDDAERSMVVAHLDDCAACRETWRAWQAIAEATRMLTVGSPVPSRLPEAVRAAIDIRGPGSPRPTARTTRRQRTAAALPHPLTPLIGRHRELAELGAFLGNSEVRLLTLVGPGGVGKTRLALVAAELAARDFGDGVCFVDLTGVVDPALVPAAIAQALGVASPTDRPVEESLIEHLIAWNLLLVLDQFEHLLEGVRFVRQILAVCSEIVVLATSRERLGVYGEHVYRVDPLSLPDAARPATVSEVAGSEAVQLFVERARIAHPAFALTDANAADVAAICGRLDGLPLAIELAAARIGMLSPAALRARFDSSVQLTPAGWDRPTRHQTMRDAIAWSYHQLTPSEQAGFRFLAVFAGGFTRGAAASILKSVLPPSVVTDVLTSLSDKGVMRRTAGLDGNPRFTMPDIVRQFGIEQLLSNGEEEAVRWAHAGYVLALAERAAADRNGMPRVDWLSKLDAEAANIQSALQWCVAQGEGGGQTALRLCKAVWPLWQAHGHNAEASLWLRRAVDGTNEANPQLLAEASLLLGHSLRRESAADAAAYYRQSLELFRRAGDARGEASACDALQMLGITPSVTIQSPPEPTGPASRLQSDWRSLSPREWQVLCLIAGGRRDREIAGELGIPVRTVTTLVTRILGKLMNANLSHDRTGAAAYVVSHGLCDSAMTGTGEGTAPSQPTTPAPASGLSDRERQILCLIVEGLTDRQIGTRLGVRVTTVATFEARIIGKVGVENRAAAAAYAVRHGLCRDER